MRRFIWLVWLFASAGAAGATQQFDFRYDFASGEAVSGSFLGELQGDGDTLDVLALLASSLGGLGFVRCFRWRRNFTSPGWPLRTRNFRCTETGNSPEFGRGGELCGDY